MGQSHHRDSAWRDVIYKGNDNYYLMAHFGGAIGRAAVGGNFGTTNVNVFGTVGPPLNTWSHLAATYDGDDGPVLYQRRAGRERRRRPAALATSTNPLEIGGDSIFGQFFQGTIDEIRIYNVARTRARFKPTWRLRSAGPAGGPDVTKTHSGSFVRGQTGATYTLTAINSGADRRRAR